MSPQSSSPDEFSRHLSDRRKVASRTGVLVANELHRAADIRESLRSWPLWRSYTLRQTFVPMTKGPGLTGSSQPNPKT